MDREKLAEKLFYYFGFDYPDGTYVYNLTRVKSAFHIGTMTLDDFEEIDDEFIYDLADFILELMPQRGKRVLVDPINDLSLSFLDELK